MTHRYLAPATVAAAVLVALAGPANAMVFVNDEAAYTAAAPTAALTEDFEATGQPLDTQLFAGFSNSGVTYLGLAGTPAPNIWIASAGYNNFGAGVGTTTSKVLTANGDESFVVTFASAVSAFGFDAYFNGLGPTTLNVYNGVTLIDSLTTPGGFDFIGHLGVAGVGAITSFTWVTTSGGQLNTGIDNLTTAQAIPEPSTYALMAFGLAAVAGLSRRRSRR
jgi:hypothetical protein